MRHAVIAVAVVSMVVGPVASPPVSAAANCPRPATPVPPRTAGADRLHTAAAALADVSGDVDTVVVVGASSYADAAVGAVLAAGSGAPLLLTDRAQLSSVARDTLARLDRDRDGGRAFVVGGGAVVASRVDDDLRRLGFVVTRVSGDDRYATALAASRHHDASAGSSAVVTSGTSWTDLVAAAAFASATSSRLLLTPPDDARALQRHVVDDDVVVVGGTGVVSETAARQLLDHAESLRRIAGPTPVSTVARVAGELGGRPAIVATAEDWPDAVVAAAMAARKGNALLLVGAVVDSSTAATLPGRSVHVIGGPAAVPPHVAAEVVDIAAGTRGAPYPTGNLPDCGATAGTAGQPTRIDVTLDRGTWSDVRTTGGAETSVTVAVKERTVSITVVPERPGVVPVTFEAKASDGSGVRRVARGWTIRAASPTVRAPEGWLVASGNGPVVGSGGPVVRYSVEVADGLERRQDPAQFAAMVEDVLSHPRHGWTARGAHRLQRVDDPRVAHVRVLLASPSHVDRRCAEAGLNTGSIYSCWNGRFAALNSDRWFGSVAHVPDLTLYRTYLVNHEVGHGLGYRHRSCPAKGALAPVMMQLSKSTYGCRPNGWPYP